MILTNATSIEAQYKIVQFLKDEFNKLKHDYPQEPKKSVFARKKIYKKLQGLSFKIASILKVNSLDVEVLEELRSLKQEIKDYYQ